VRRILCLFFWSAASLNLADLLAKTSRRTGCPEPRFSDPFSDPAPSQIKTSSATPERIALVFRVPSLEEMGEQSAIYSGNSTSVIRKSMTRVHDAEGQCLGGALTAITSYRMLEHIFQGHPRRLAVSASKITGRRRLDPASAGGLRACVVPARPALSSPSVPQERSQELFSVPNGSSLTCGESQLWVALVTR